VSVVTRIDGPRERPHPTLPPDLPWLARLEHLRGWLGQVGCVVVAYSGGVDSSVLLRAAHEVLGERALGVIGRSDSYSERELALALEQARGFGARVEIVTTGELSDPNFRSNPADRCYFCKRELYRQLAAVSVREQAGAIVDGTLLDDLADWRPGRRAAAEAHVRSPLAELGFTKVQIRQVAVHYGLPSRDKPASPCLASRFPYGTTITRELLTQVDRAEQLLCSLGFTECRVRHHGDVARIEVPLADIARLLVPEVRERVVAGLREFGYLWVAVDMAGLRSGSLNAALGNRAASGR
jgi:pyridinium-3,5-biscarboxylic acid mononucleotide sulfurtransferase